MVDNTASIIVEIADDIDQETLEELTYELLGQILEIDVDNAELVRGESSPRGSRSIGETVQIGAILVTAARSPELLKGFLGLIESWVTHRQGRHVRVEIDGDILELDRASIRDQRDVVHEWLRRHGNP